MLPILITHGGEWVADMYSHLRTDILKKTFRKIVLRPLNSLRPIYEEMLEYQKTKMGKQLFLSKVNFENQIIETDTFIQQSVSQVINNHQNTRYYNEDEITSNIYQSNDLRYKLNILKKFTRKIFNDIPETEEAWSSVQVYMDMITPFTELSKKTPEDAQSYRNYWSDDTLLDVYYRMARIKLNRRPSRTFLSMMNYFDDFVTSNPSGNDSLLFIENTIKSFIGEVHGIYNNSRSSRNEVPKRCIRGWKSISEPKYCLFLLNLCSWFIIAELVPEIATDFAEIVNSHPFEDTRDILSICGISVLDTPIINPEDLGDDIIDPIDLEPFKIGDDIVSLACSHKLKKSNLISMIQHLNSRSGSNQAINCPICRFTIGFTSLHSSNYS